MHHKGHNNYLKEKGGLSFRIRRTFICNESGDGIIPVDLAPKHEGQTLTGSLLNENIACGLKYEVPDIKSLDKARLTNEMITILDRYMDKSKMSQDHCEVWDQIMYDCETDNENEEMVDAEVDSNNGFFVDDTVQEEDESVCVSCSLMTLGSNDSVSFDTVSEFDENELDGNDNFSK